MISSVTARLATDGTAREVSDDGAWRRLARGRLAAALRCVEEVPAQRAGALLVGARERPAGTILVERNRVCWAVAGGMARRLRDLLLAVCDPPVEAATLDALFVRCRDERRPLGEALVDEGLIAAEGMRAALAQHTAECLLALDASFPEEQAELPLSWLERATPGYNSRFTFAPVEILATAGASLLAPIDAELVAEHLGALAGVGCAALAIAEPLDGRAALVGASTLWFEIADATSLGDWALAALAASPGFSPAVAHALARSSSGAAVAWHYEGHRYAAICPSQPSLQRLVALLDNQSLALVLATRHGVLDRVRARMTEATHDPAQGE